MYVLFMYVCMYEYMRTIRLMNDFAHFVGLIICVRCKDISAYKSIVSYALSYKVNNRDRGRMKQGNGLVLHRVCRVGNKWKK